MKKTKATKPDLTQAWIPKFKPGDNVLIKRPHLWGDSPGEIEEIREHKYYVAIFGNNGTVFHTEVTDEHLQEDNPFERV